ncbi:MAG: hypothetical protein SVQ76_00410 [Candidatus Nanohaloarchaea archaeon]|nr:hypothetical protein [Candidatus Nanohaloarchaea archaeon]
MKRRLAALTLAVATAVLLAVPLVAAQQQDTFEGSLETLKIGENGSINVTVINPLPVSDVLKVSFTGEAIEEGLVATDFPSDGSISCNEMENICELTLNANSEKVMNVNLQGTAIGQGPLEATVNSTTTQLDSTDRMEVRVRPLFAPVTVSAAGIQGLHVIILALAGSVLVGIAARKKDLKERT